MYTYGLRNEERKQICIITSQKEFDYSGNTMSLMDLFEDEDTYYQLMDALDWYEDETTFVDYVGEYKNAYESFYGNKDYEITSVDYLILIGCITEK